MFSIINPSKQNASPTTRNTTMKTLNLGNNESVSSGVTANHDGTFTAMTFTKSKTFKTERGAVNWLKRMKGE